MGTEPRADGSSDGDAPADTTRTMATTGAIETPRPVSSVELGAAETLPAATSTHEVERGRVFGRFTVTALLGRGGMGEVYAADDPDLGRRVAIKLLRPELSTTRADERLRREARAMARLSHPNLVTVHDVGVHDGQLFVAMELIAGGTLRTWAAAGDRSWRDILAVYVAAGRGLAAAHAAGIVHRDFKPDNVLVGKDGRVAVGDFGLALTSMDTGVDAEGIPSAHHDAPMTQAGALLGTLRYMAPEQLERRVADDRSDQFAFCVSLWEALDDDPFDAVVAGSDATITAESRRASIAAGPRRRRLANVPVRISRALLRGLSPDPAGRWPSMEALLEHIDPARRRSQIAGVAAALGAVGVAIGTTWWLREPSLDPCAAVSEPMQQVWRPGSVQRLQAAFAATKRPNAVDAAARTAAILDRRAIAWSLMRSESCRSTASGAQNADLDRRRTQCLELRLAELGTLVGALTEHPTADMVDLSIRAANGLPAIEVCGNVSALLERPAAPDDPVKRARIASLEAEISRAHALERLGDVAVVPRLADLERQAIALDWAPAIALIGAVIGHEAWRRGDGATAEPKLRAAAIAAARAKDDELGVRVLALHAQSLIDADRASDAIEVAHSAELLATRAGDMPGAKAEALEALAAAYAAQSKFEDSDREFGRTIDLLQQTNTDRLQLARALTGWSNQLYNRSDYTRALPLATQALALIRDELGPDHPDYGRVVHNYGNHLVAVRRFADASAKFEEALAIKQRVYGDDAPTVAQTLHGLGNVAHELGEDDRAGSYYRRAADIWERKLGPDHSLSLMARFSLANNLRRQRKFPEAIALAEDVLAKRSAAKSPQPEKIANVLELLGNCYFDLGDRTRALGYHEHALAIREKTLGPETSDVAMSLAGIAEIHGSKGDCAKAVPLANRSIAVLHKIPGGDEETGGPTLVLATCAERARQRDEAIRLYTRALELLARDPRADKERARARAALAALGGSSPAPR